jgi:hypothetical protein
MFSKSPIHAKLDEEIVRTLEKLAKLDPKSEEYKTLTQRMSELHQLKVEERPKQISPDTVLAVAANIFGILWIARYEREHILSSKAFGIAMKLPR